MSSKKNISILILFLSFFHSFAQVKLFSFSNNLEKKSMDSCWMNLATLKKGNAFSGDYYSSTDSVNRFSFGYKGYFPKSCLNKNVKVISSAKVRSENAVKNVFLILSLSVGDSTLFWKAFNISDSLAKYSSWNNVTAEFNVPGSLTQSKITLSSYVWNKEGKLPVDLDDFKIDFQEMHFPGYLPEKNSEKESKSGWMKMNATKSLNLFYNKEDGNVKLITVTGDTLIRSIDFYSEWKDDSHAGKPVWAGRLNLKGDSLTEEGMYFHFTAGNEISENDMLLLAGANGTISFVVKTWFRKSVSLIRHAVCVGYSLPLKEVERKNKLADTTDFKNEYWLGREGFVLSNNTVSLILYKPENISSIQLDVKNKQVIMNMDYSADHPMLHYPLLQTNENKFEDYSNSIYAPGDTLKCSFEYFTSLKAVKMSRLLANPKGYLSSWVWTDHADYGDIRTNKAVYFGSDRVNSSTQATAGFVKYNIPVTKSIFYANPDKLNNQEKYSLLPGAEVSFKESEPFRDFLRQLHTCGNEICLHTPDHYTTTRKLLFESLDVMRKEFNQATWIDHGYDNSEKSNREDMVCDGNDPMSPFYAADLWKIYGLKYFWDPYYEDTGIYSDFSFNSFFSVPYSGWGDAFPTPLYWRNRRTENLIHFGTVGTIDLPDGNLWPYLFDDERLNDLVNNRTDVIVHCYTSRVDSTNGFYILKNGEVSINDNFNDALKKLAAYRADSKIWLTTIRELLSYRLSLETIRIAVLPDGEVLVENKGKDPVNGLTLSAYATEVTAKGKAIQSKTVNGEFIFWFDLLPGEQTMLSIK